MYRSSRNQTTILFLSTLIFSVGVSAQGQNIVSVGQPRAAVSVLDSTKEQDGLVGSVRRVKIEAAKIEMQDGRPIEGPRQLLELTTYGIKGNRIENISYPSGDSQTNKEEYKYDDRGNISELTLRDDRGAIVSRQAYTYEFDTFGNWTKMVTSLIVFENGELKREPVEVTYRLVTYYFDDSIAKIVDTTAPRIMPRAPLVAQLLPVSLENTGIGSDVSLSAHVNEPSLASAGDPPPLMIKRSPAQPPSSTLDSDPAERKAQASNSVALQIGSLGGRTTAAGTSIPKSDVAVKSAATNNVSLRVAAARPSPEVSASESVPTISKPPANIDARKVAFNVYQTGLAHFEAGDFQAAVEAYLESIKLEFTSAEVYLNLGTAYLKLDKDAEAAKAFKQSVKLNADVAEAHYGFGLASYRLKRYRDAAGAFKKATTLSPNMAKAHLGLALAYQELGEQNFVLDEYRILELLDKSMAKKLAQSFRKDDLPCRSIPFCQ